MSVANDIAVAISNRVATISIANGYETDIGLRVFRGRKRLDKVHLPCIVIIERDDTVLDQRPTQIKVSQPFIIEGHMACDPDNPNDTAHKMLDDIKRAVFASNITYGDGKPLLPVKYSGKSIAPREDGLEVVSAAVEIVVEFVDVLRAT